VSIPLLEVRHVKKYFPLTSGFFFSRISGYVRAVDDVSFCLEEGKTLGIVGESGSGKSTLGRVVLRLLEPTSGEVLFEGEDVFKLNRRKLRELRRKMQVIFQDPYASLNPRMTVGEILAEPLVLHGLLNGKLREERVKELLNLVGLNARHASRYPHEFSGGQRQRIGVARALAVEPKLIVADEPVSALDVSIQAQVVNLMQDLQEKFKLAYLFISHDLSVVKHISNNVAVMYLGKIVEKAEKNELYDNPLHPYTKALMSAIPIPDPEVESRRQRIILSGDLPSPINPPPGCPFHTRCPMAIDKCKEELPLLREVKPGHYVACIRV
jgi:oligopeptide transport system ATP-binding protein